MRWKWILAIGVLTIVILMAAVYVYLNTYDYNKLKPLVAQMVEDATGRKLSLGGEVNLEIGFAPALVVTDVALANVSWGSQPQMIEIERLQARVRLLPLLFKDLDIKYIRLVGVNVLLETGPEAQGNWVFLAGSTSTGGSGLFKPTAIEVSRVSIENLRLTFRGNRTGSPRHFTLASLEMNRQGNEDALALKFKADYKGQPLSLSGKTGRVRDVFAHQRLPLQLSGTLANSAVKINGAVDDILTLQGIDVAARLNGKNFASLGPFLDIQLPETKTFDAAGHLKGSGEALRLDNINGNLSGSSIDMAISGSVANLIAFSGVDLKLKISGKDLAVIAPVIGEKLPATDQFEIRGRLSGSTDALALQEAEGSAARGSMRLSFTGAVKDLLTLKGMDLQSRLTGKELAEIGPLAEAELPELGAFDVRSKLSGAAADLSLNAFSAIIDKSDFKGLARVAFLKRPKITIRLESSVIDLTALMKSFEMDEQKPDKKSKQRRRLFSDASLPFDILKKMDADIVLKAKNIYAKNARLDFGHLALKLEDHDFSIDKLEATYKETKISGNFKINAGTPSQADTRFLVQNFNLGEFLKETGKSDKVQAIVDIAGHGKSSGDSVHSLMANLDGSIGAVMGAGYLTQYLDMLSAGLSQKVIQIWRPPEAADQIRCAVVQFDIKNGVAASQAFVFNTRAGTLAGGGEINLGTERINFLLVPKSAHPDLSLATTLRVSGSIMDPKVRPDTVSLLTKGAEALSALAVGPLALLAPFVHLGANNSHPCDVQSIGQLGLNAPAKEKKTH